MPNFCENVVLISGNEGDIKKIFDAKMCFNKLRPCPPCLTTDNEKETVEKLLVWQSFNWGTKWDIVDENGELINGNKIELDTNGGIKAELLTAWSPPVNLFEYLTTQMKDLHVVIHYWEPGCEVLGTADIRKGNTEFYDISDEVPFIKQWFDSDYEPYESESDE